MLVTASRKSEVGDALKGRGWEWGRKRPRRKAEANASAMLPIHLVDRELVRWKAMVDGASVRSGGLLP